MKILIIFQFTGKIYYLSGRLMFGNSCRIIFTISEKWETLSTRQYLPLAEGTSKARICALATSFTLTQPKLALGKVEAPGNIKYTVSV